jgi:hypothetical protein
MVRILKRLAPALIALALAGLVVYQLISQAKIECRVCVTFDGRRNCATGVAPVQAEAREEAHRSACALLTSGVTEAFACPNTAPDEVSCKER